MYVSKMCRQSAVLLAVLVTTFTTCEQSLAQKPKPGGTTPPPTVEYRMTLLGTLGGPTSRATGMNARGDIVGLADTENFFETSDGRIIYRKRPFLNVAADGERHTFDVQKLAENAGVIKMPLPERGDVKQWVLSWAAGINDAGQIVGDGYLVDEKGGRSAPMVWRLTLSSGVSAGVPDVLGVLEDCGGSPGGGTIVPIRINNDGDIVGRFSKDGNWIAFLYTDEHGLTDLGTLNGADTKACGLTSRDSNDNVLIAGTAASDTKAWQMQATITKESLTTGTMQDIGGLLSRGPTTSASGMNELGQIVGGSKINRDHWRGYLFTPGSGFQNLGTLSTSKSWTSSTANAINNLGDVVGHSHDGTSTLQPTLYRKDLGLINLISLIHNFDAVKGEIGQQDFFDYAMDPVDINDAGQICGPPYQTPPYGQAWILDLVP